MDVQLLSQAAGLQAAASSGAQAESAVLADPALFQKLMQAALAPKVQASESGAVSGQGDGAAEDTDQLGLLLRMMLGGSLAGSAYPAEERTADVAELAGAAVPEEAEAADGTRLWRQTGIAAALAKAAAALDAIAGGAPVVSADSAAESLLNASAAEAAISNVEAASAGLSAGQAADLKGLLGGTPATPAAWPAASSAAADAGAAAQGGEQAEDAEAIRTAASGAGYGSTAAEDAAETDGGQAAAVLIKTGNAAEHADSLANRTGAADGLRQTDRANQAGAGETAAATAADSPAAGRTETLESRPANQAAPPEPYRQISEEIMKALANKGQTTLSMQLEPAELGRIDIQMKMSNGKLVIDIAAQSAATQAMLTGQADKLIAALGLHNVQVESLQTAVQPASASQPEHSGLSQEFLMDFAHKGRQEQQAGQGGTSGSGQKEELSPSGIANAQAVPVRGHYTRRMDLTA
ncbi:MAG: flagellar hook-length control protein FliK [Clostridiales Family XIII bacterium]|jgi:flagellar hook-length control protein FliK|nr:flagellar hook-length control protein FliK [Clostridiales Family XIII bacterium]